MNEPKQVSPGQIEAAVNGIKSELAEATRQLPQRLDLSPEGLDQGLAKLVLSLVELLRRVLERQAIRRMEGGSLTDEQIETMGTSLMALEQKVNEMAGLFGLKPEDLNLDLGPLTNLSEK
jgi:gas vesicle protein GvpK